MTLGFGASWDQTLSFGPIVIKANRLTAFSLAIEVKLQDANPPGIGLLR